MKTGIEFIAEERARQITVEGWTPEHDDNHVRGEIAAAAACYAKMAQLLEIGKWSFDAASEIAARNWHWEEQAWKPSRDSRRNLEKAGALIAAEIDRLERLKRACLPRVV